MLNLQNYLIFAYLINIIACLIFGFLVYRRKRYEEIGKAFLLLCFFVILYAFAYLLFILLEDKNMALFWLNVSTVCSFFLPVATLHLMVAIFNDYKKYKKIILGGYLFYTLLTPLMFTAYVIKDIVPKFSLRYWPEPGGLYDYLMATFFLYTVYTAYYLFKKYRKSQGRKKEQAKYVLVGLISSYIGGATNFFYWYDINIPPVGGILVCSYVGFFTYAIITQHLMDIRLVMKKSSVYLFALITTLLLLFPIKFFLVGFSEGYVTFFDFALIILTAIIFPKIKTFFSLMANKFLFTSLYDSQEIMSRLSKKLRSTLDIELLYKYIYESLIYAFHLKSFGILGYNFNNKNYKIRYNSAFPVKDDVEFPINRELHDKFVKKNKPIVLDDLKEAKNESYKSTIVLMEKYKAELLIPLNAKNKIIGLMVLGQKETKEIYNKEDLRVLEIISGFVSTALENANLYIEVKEKNKYLNDLLNMKRDFLRVVNHQLNTPVSIMRLGFSGAKEKSISSKRSLEIAEAGLERITSTLEIFWEAYELEGENIKIDAGQFDMLKLIEKQVKEKKRMPNFKKKKIKIEIKIPPYEMKNVFGEEKKITHVVANLLENAIGYTKEGKITISFEYIKEQNTNYLKTYISDSGVGIPRGDLKNLFKKFTRGSKAALVQPDGSGLGLYIAERIIDAHKGKLALEKTKEEAGTTFSFTLASYKNQIPNINKIKQYVSDEPKTIAKKNGKSLSAKQKILFIDDNETYVDIYKKFFSRKGFAFYSTCDIDKIFGLASTISLDFIILDIIIPKIQSDGAVDISAEQGYEFLKKLKNNPLTKNIPVIMFSNLNTREDRKKAKELGAYKFLFKNQTRQNDFLKIFEKINHDA